MLSVYRKVKNRNLKHDADFCIQLVKIEGLLITNLQVFDRKFKIFSVLNTNLQLFFKKKLLIVELRSLQKMQPSLVYLLIIQLKRQFTHTEDIDFLKF